MINILSAIFLALAEIILISLLLAEEIRRFLILKSRIGNTFLALNAIILLTSLLSLGLIRTIQSDPQIALTIYKIIIILFRTALIALFVFSILIRSERFNPVITAPILVIYGANIAAFVLRSDVVTSKGDSWVVTPKYSMMEDPIMLLDTSTLLLLALVTVISILYSGFKIYSLLKNKKKFSTSLTYFIVGILVAIIGTMIVFILRRIAPSYSTINIMMNFWFLLIGIGLIAVSIIKHPVIVFVLPTELKYFMVLWKEQAQLIFAHPDDAEASLYASFIGGTNVALNNFIKRGFIRSIELESYTLILDHTKNITGVMILSSPLIFYKRLLNYLTRKYEEIIVKYNIEPGITIIAEEPLKEFKRLFKMYVDPFVV